MKGLVKTLFLLAAATHLFLAVAGHSETIYIGSKLILMPLLMMLALIYRSEAVVKPIWTLMIVALFFSFLGDLFLSDLFDREQSFIYGLGSFLLTQILYILIFRISAADPKKLTSRKLIVPSVLIIAWAVTIFINIKAGLGDLKLPVAVYVLVITLMCLFALARFEAVAKNSFVLLLLGAILFMISDMLIALNRFYSPIEHERILVMSTYIIAQFLLLEGIRTNELSINNSIKSTTDDI